MEVIPVKEGARSVRQASVDRNKGLMIHGSNLIIETPLYLGRKVRHKCKSDLRSFEMGQWCN